MKSFQYKAKDQFGEVVEGIIETNDFDDATQDIRSKGLTLLALELLKEQAQTMRPFIFDALDKRGEKVQGTIQGIDEDNVTKMLQEEFGYQVTQIRSRETGKTAGPQIIKVPVKDDEKNEEESPVSQHSPPTELSSASKPRNLHEKNEDDLKVEKKKKSSHENEENIIFHEKPKIIKKEKNLKEEELEEAHNEIQELLSEKGARISESTKKKLHHLDEKIDLLRESDNKTRWRLLKKKLRKVKKLAEREIKEHEDKKWEEHEKKDTSQKIENYSEISEEKPKKIFQAKEKIEGWKKWFKVVDLPNEDKDDEVLLKQQYESVWNELQRFTGALFAFYLLCFFLGYYLTRSGLDDNFIVRIYETTLFKQIILTLFSLYALLTVRILFLNKRIKSDAIVFGLWLLFIWWVFW